ncbi:MAG: alpha/beta hydrolase [Verrucomicrobiales bacterium]
MVAHFVSTATSGVVFEGLIKSEAFKANRFVRIYLPESYAKEPSRRYPVLYVHDGQNAFSTVGPHVAFGWGNWALDQTAAQLAREGKMGEVIMVAVDCSRSRYREYRGPTAASDNSAYEKYKSFLIDELMPKIDREYRTLVKPANTGVIGSSMGGICSLSLAWERPDVFGKAASLSGAFQVENKYFLKKVLAPYTGKPKKFSIYLDSGSSDYSGGDDGLKDTLAIADQLRRIGWKDGKNLMVFTDPLLTAEQLSGLNLPGDKFKEAQTSQHNEMYWRLRAWRPLVFMFPPE